MKINPFISLIEAKSLPPRRLWLEMFPQYLEELEIYIYFNFVKLMEIKTIRISMISVVLQQFPGYNEGKHNLKIRRLH